MKVHFKCFQCATNVDKSDIDTTVYSFPVGNEYIYEVKCNKNHITLMFLQNSKFEILFESGIHAIKDDYYREAVFNFSVALERFYEYSILFFLSDRIGFAMNAEELNGYIKMWSQISKQSERQIGAFYSLYFNEFNKIPPIFSNNWLNENTNIEIKKNGKKIDPIQFRNLVIHQGHVPSRDEAVSFGEAVHRYIHSLLNEFWNKDESRINRVIHIEKTLHKIKVNKQGSEAHTGINTFMAASQPNYVKKDKSLFDLLNIYP